MIFHGITQGAIRPNNQRRTALGKPQSPILCRITAVIDLKNFGVKETRITHGRSLSGQSNL